MLKYHIFFSGRVQGVGFRWTAHSIASDFPISGWVKNLPDGRVELIAVGKKSDLDQFVEALKHRMRRQIVEHTLDTTPAVQHMPGFEIRY